MKRGPEGKEAAPARSLVLVVGAGRDESSLFSGIVQRLGFYVPQPEAPADERSSGGSAESHWVAGFHARLLKRARVQASDARPTAWAQTARVALDENTRRELLSWLESQFGHADHIVINDPRIRWFLPLWRRCAEAVEAAPRFATVLRHPAAVISGEPQHGEAPRDHISRAAGWLNGTLFAERATREAPRVFVRDEDLLDDWARAIARVGDALGLRVIADASWTSMVKVAQSFDPPPGPRRADGGAITIPVPLRDQVGEVWELMCRLAEGEGNDEQSLRERLDAARSAYIDFYEQAEAVAQSSVWAAGRPQRAAGTQHSSPDVVRLLPARLRHRVPLRWRQAMVRKLRHSGGPTAGGKKEA